MKGICKQYINTYYNVHIIVRNVRGEESSTYRKNSGHTHGNLIQARNDILGFI